MEYDSIMDISMNLNTIDDVSAVNDVSMELSAAVTPVPDSWAAPTSTKIETIDVLETVKKIDATIPNCNAVFERQKKALASKYASFLL
jgi:hypothetical protein